MSRDGEIAVRNGVKDRAALSFARYSKAPTYQSLVPYPFATLLSENIQRHFPLRQKLFLSLVGREISLGSVAT